MNRQLDLPHRRLTQRAQSAEGCELDLDELLCGANNTLYLYAPASEQERLRPLFELLVSVVIYKAEQLAAAQPDGMLDPRLFVCLDEAGNCAAIKKLPQGEPSRVSCRLHTGCGSGWRAAVAV